MISTPSRVSSRTRSRPFFQPIFTSPPSYLPSTYQFIAHFGDIAYADYFIKESWQGSFGNNSLIPNMTSVMEGYNVLLEQFYDQMTPLTSSKAYMVAVGNHEASLRFLFSFPSRYLSNPQRQTVIMGKL